MPLWTWQPTVEPDPDAAVLEVVGQAVGPGLQLGVGQPALSVLLAADDDGLPLVAELVDQVLPEIGQLVGHASFIARSGRCRLFRRR